MKIDLPRIARALLLPLAVAATSLLTQSLRADTEGLNVNASYAFRPTSAYTVGWSFSLSNAINLTQLGFFDTGGGLPAAEEVDVFSSNHTLVAKATLPAGTTGSSLYGFRYVNISPVGLPAGTYDIAAYVPANTSYLSVGGTVSGAPGVTYNGPLAQAGGAPGTDPSGNVLATNPGYFGPNFQFVVPEPSAWALLTLGSVGAGIAGLRRRPWNV